MYSDIAQEIYVVQIKEPVAVVHHDGGIIEIKEPAELRFKACYVMCQIFVREHLAHIGITRRIADFTGPAAYEGDRSVTRALHMSHDHDLYEMTDVERIRRGVKTNLERHRLAIEQLFYFLRIGALGNDSAFNEFVVHTFSYHII